MSEKNYVTMIERICVACGEQYSENELALNTRLKPVFEPVTVVGFGLCDKCLEKAKEQNGLWVFSTEKTDDTVMLKECVCFNETAIRELFKNDLPEAPRKCLEFEDRLLENLLHDIRAAQEKANAEPTA